MRCGRSLLGFLAALFLAALSGCASGPFLPKELVDARVAMKRARQSPMADRAPVPLAEAEDALAEAEYQAFKEPGRQEARDLAYVARRKAERARIAGLHEADLEALKGARSSVARLQENLARRSSSQAELARRLHEEHRTREAQRARLTEELANLGAAASLVERRPGGALIRIDWEQLFYRGSSMLRPGAKARIAAIAGAIRSGPPCQVRIQVLDDQEPIGLSDKRTLAQRREKRLRDALVARGVAPEVFLPAERVTKVGTSVDVVLTEQGKGAPPVTVASGRAPEPKTYRQ
jgi:flagellar motor protein MotB